MIKTVVEVLIADAYVKTYVCVPWSFILFYIYIFLSKYISFLLLLLLDIYKVSSQREGNNHMPFTTILLSQFAVIPVKRQNLRA